MPDQSEVSVDLQNVNKETLELLERRISANVRKTFLMAVTIPIGGGGLLAVIVTILTWLPQKVDTIVRETAHSVDLDTKVVDKVDDVVREVAGKKVVPLVQLQMTAEVREQVKSVVEEYLGSDAGRQVLAGDVKKSVGEALPALVQQALPTQLQKSFRSPEISNLITTAATEYVEGEGKVYIANVVKETLRPTLETVRATVQERSDRLVVSLADDAILASREVEKTHPEALPEILDKVDKETAEQDETNGQGKTPVVITMTVGIGKYYDLDAIGQWLDKFTERFPERFKYVALLYGAEKQDGVFVALVEKDAFRRKLDENGALMALLRTNAADVTYDEAAARVATLFGRQSTRRISHTAKIGPVLKDGTIWLPQDGVAKDVPVVDEADELVGFTNREALEQALLEQI